MKTETRNIFQMQALAATAALALATVLAVPAALAQDTSQAPAAQAGQRTDGQIETDVVQALDGSDALKNDLITAATIQGAVTLSGTVASDANRQLAESIVAKIPGVAKVNNKLKVGNPAEDPNNVPQATDNTAPPTDGQAEQGSAPPPTFSPSPNQPPQPSYPNDNQQAQGQQAQGYPPPQPGYGQPNNAPPPPAGPGPGYGRPAYPGYPPPPGYAQPYQPYATARGPITVAPGTVLQLRTNAAMDEKHAKEGQPIDFTVIRDVAVNGYLAIPRGATVHGVITESKHAGQLTGSPELALRLTSLDIDGRTYPLDSDEFRVKGPSKTGRTVGNAIGGALVGALIGGAVGGGEGAAIGAGVGGAGGTAASAAGGPHAWIPAEALVTFHLNGPVTVDPVSREEANRLAQGLFQGGPELYRRGYYRPGYPPPPGYYGYPQVYYRPYVFEGGYYYWR
jgi:hypothetical protein